MKTKKGCFGYIDGNRKFSTMKALGGLGVILIIFVAGIIIMKTRLNWFTFVSVLCALPVGKMIVNMIMTLPHKSMPQADYQKIAKKEEGIYIIYDLIITSYEKVMHIDSIAIRRNTLCAYTTDLKLEEDKAEKYIKDILVNNGCSTSIKIYKDLNSYLTRIDEMKSNISQSDKSETAMEREKKKETTIVETLLAISI